jgi:hypothetical protein
MPKKPATVRIGGYKSSERRGSNRLSRRLSQLFYKPFAPTADFGTEGTEENNGIKPSTRVG